MEYIGLFEGTAFLHGRARSLLVNDQKLTAFFMERFLNSFQHQIYQVVVHYRFGRSEPDVVT